MTALTVHQLGHLDLLALALRRVPGCGDESARYYAGLSREKLIDLLTRHREAA